MVNLENERKGFEYHVTKRIGLSEQRLQRDPDNQGNYSDQYVNAVWAGWQAGVLSYAKRKG
jgi:hypothetical protein